MINKPNSPQNKPPTPGGNGPLPKYNRGPYTWLIICLVVLTLLMTLTKMNRVKELDFSEFKDYVEKGFIVEVAINESGRKITGKFNEQGQKIVGENVPEEFSVSYIPEFLPEDFPAWLEQYEVHVYKSTGESYWLPILLNLFPIILIVGLLWFFFMRNLKGGGGMLMNFGRSKHRLQGKGSKVTFDDVAGIEEAKEEVAELIEFLKNPKKFKKLGGRIPRGVLLEGPPGCGKTLLAKAIAGEAEVPFFSIAGSDFVEMFVGVGASRVRDLFKQAKENCPCIIFLDEIDAIGKKRGPGFVSGGHDEREQTLNAILVEMDGFDTDDQVIVVAATNRGDILDKALTRPGRFDRQVVVPLPDLKGRMKILKIHAQKIKYDPGVDFEKLARGTPMFSGAELEALINEAAIGASMQDKDYVEMPDFEEARDKVRWGRVRSREVDENDRKMTAYHESGHALIQCMLEEADPLHKVSIIPRGPMGGATFVLPEKDRQYYSKKYCLAELQVFFGGRIAEELFCDDITSGAQSDIKQATMIAREMVTEWGMGEELGPIKYSPATGADAYYGMGGAEYSQKTAETIDREIKNLIDQAYSKATDLIKANRDKIEALTQALIKYETLDAEEVKIILDGGTLNKPTVSELIQMEQEKDKENEKKSDTLDDDYDIYADAEDWEKELEEDEENDDETA